MRAFLPKPLLALISPESPSVAQPVVGALDRASIITTHEKDTHPHSSRESRLRTKKRLQFCWFDDAIDVLPLTRGKICAVLALLKHRGYSSGMALHFGDQVLFSRTGTPC